MPGGAPHPVGQRRPVEIDALASVNLGLPIERQVIGVFGDKHLNDRRLGRNAACDQPRRRGLLQNNPLAGPTSIFRSPHHEHAELGGDDIELLAHILADPVKLSLTTRADLIGDVDDRFDAWQMRWQRPTIDASLWRLGWLDDGSAGLGRGFNLFDIFERQQHLVFRQRLGAAAKTVSLELLDDLDETLVAGSLGDQHRLEHARIIGKCVDRSLHKRSRPYSAAARDRFDHPDSLRHSSSR